MSDASPRSTNALVTACELVGREIGVAITPPPELGDAARRDRLAEVARASRVRTRRVMLRADWWRHDNGPLLGWAKEDGHPVALLLTPSLRYVAVEPATGSRTPVTPAFVETLEPWADAFYTPLPARALRAADLLRIALVNVRRRDLVMIAIAGLGAGVLGTAPAIATGVVLDEVVPRSDARGVALLAAALLVTIVAGALLQLTRSLTVLRVEARSSAAVQAGVWDRLLGLPASFFRDYVSGDLALRSLGIDSIRQAITGATLSSLLNGLFSVASFCILFYFDVRLALLATVVVVVASAAVAGLGALELRYHRGVQRLAGEVSGIVLQLVSGIAKLRIAAAEERGFALFAARFGEQKRLAVKARNVANALAVLAVGLPTLATVALFAVVAPRPEHAGGAGVDTATFLAFYAAFGQLLMAGLQMSVELVFVLRVVPLYERARPILEATPEVDPAKAAPPTLSGDLELRNVSFRYRPDGPLVLDDVSISARAGELVAVVGPSGAGKSTVMRLLLGFEAPSAGTVLVDGTPLADLDAQAVRRQMGVVLQHGGLLPGSLFDNIVGATSATLEDATVAARLAGLGADIDAMPMGLHTYVPEGGSTLSGGQRQRLLIARAVVSRPRILLFDEATSALDNRTQAEVTESLEGLHATRIVIAHRLSTIARADRIYVVVGGRVAQVGTYAELVDRPGPFADLARRQLV